jgi:hypothetical protein
MNEFWDIYDLLLDWDFKNKLCVVYYLFVSIIFKSEA